MLGGWSSDVGSGCERSGGDVGLEDGRGSSELGLLVLVSCGLYIVVVVAKVTMEGKRHRRQHDAIERPAQKINRERASMTTY